MKVNSNITFQGFYTNKSLKKGLEFAAENGSLFATATMLVGSIGVRPLSIMLTPNVDKENKKALCAKSLASSLTGYLMMLGLSKPIANSIKKIDQNPKKYLSFDTIQNLKENSITLQNSKAYIFTTQMFKLGLGFVAAVPKALLTSATLPFFMNKIYSQKQTTNQSNVSFRSKNDKLTHGLAKVIENTKMQDFSKKYKNTNFPMHIVALTDILSTTTFIHEINSSKKINRERKKTLSYNSIISTSLSIISSYIIDKLLNKSTEKFIENFRKANKGLPNVEKQIEGIRIAKPILIMAGVYYTLIPILSAFMSDRVEKTVGQIKN